MSTAVRTVLFVVAVGSLAVGIVTQSAAHPPAEPNHGVNESAFWTLWAGDNDSTNLSEPNTTASSKLLTEGTDIPLDRPPRAVEMWNAGESEELPTTGAETASHPQNTTLSDGTYLRDVGVSIMALQPSTRVHLDEAKQPLYIAPDGETFGLIDYRVAVPRPTVTDSRETRWEIDSHTVESAAIYLDGVLLNETNQTRSPHLTYQDLSSASTPQTLTLEATITATLTRTVTSEREDCSGAPANETSENETTESCMAVWSTSTTKHTETITVADDATVRIYAQLVSGYQTRYPNGDLGLVTYKSYPWYGLSAPAGEVQGVWRFYVARDPSWDTLTTSMDSETTHSHSPVHPLQVHAYPVANGPTPWPRSTVSILDVYGKTFSAPELPPTIALDTVEGDYTGSFGIATRIDTTNHDLREITAVGLVRGTDMTLGPETFSAVSLSESNLTLRVINRSAETVTVQARLAVADTGEPIETTDRDGSLFIDGKRFETNESGLLSVSVSRDQDAVSARYEPGAWWRNIPGYTGDSAVVHTGGNTLQYVDALFNGFVPIGALLLGGYLISRFTTWGFWPPWRGL